MAGATKKSIGDAAVLKGTGKPAGVWYSLLDKWKGGAKGHTSMARWLREEHGLSSWWSQMVTVLYERKRGLRKVHERTTGFAVEVVRKIETTPLRAYLAMADADHQARWFTSEAKVDAKVGGRYSNADGGSGEFLAVTRPKLLRFTWNGKQHAPGSVVDYAVTKLDDDRVQVSITHAKIARESDVKDLKDGWSWAIDSLKSYLETGRGVPYDEWKKTGGAKKKAAARKKAPARPSAVKRTRPRA